MGKNSAVILAAGAGTRMKSKKSKVLHKLCGKSMINHVINTVRNSDIKDIIVVVGNGSEEVKEELGIDAKIEMVGKLVIDYGSEREILGIFAGVTDKIPHANNDKVEQIKSFNLEEIINNFMSGKFDLSGGSRDSFRYIIENGLIMKFYSEKFGKK